MWNELQPALEAAGIPQRLVRRFGGDPARLGPGRHSANLLYPFEAPDGRAWLRITPESNRPLPLIESAGAYLVHVFDRGAPVNPPLRTIDGAWLEVFEHGGQRIAASAVGHVAGDTLLEHRLEPAAWRATGVALARLHEAARDFVPAPGSDYYTVERLLDVARARIPDEETRLIERLAEARAAVAALPSGPEHVGLTHGDCNAHNLLHDGEVVRVIDFDEPVWQHFAADLARPFRDVPDAHAAARPGLRAALVEGYRGVRPLPDALVDGLRWLLLLKQIEVYAGLRFGASWAWDVLPGGERREDALASLEREIQGSPIV